MSRVKYEMLCNAEFVYSMHITSEIFCGVTAKSRGLTKHMAFFLNPSGVANVARNGSPLPG